MGGFVKSMFSCCDVFKNLFYKAFLKNLVEHNSEEIESLVHEKIETYMRRDELNGNMFGDSTPRWNSDELVKEFSMGYNVRTQVVTCQPSFSQVDGPVLPAKELKRVRFAGNRKYV